MTKIGWGAFNDIIGLTNDIIGLTKICVLAKIPPTCDFGVFRDVDKQTCELEVPQESLEAYKSANTWKNFYNITTGIGEIKSDKVKVSVVDGEISIKGVTDDAEVEIYGVNGAVVYRGTNKTIAVPSPASTKCEWQEKP